MYVPPRQRIIDGRPPFRKCDRPLPTTRRAVGRSPAEPRLERSDLDRRVRHEVGPRQPGARPRLRGRRAGRSLPRRAGNAGDRRRLACRSRTGSSPTYVVWRSAGASRVFSPGTASSTLNTRHSARCSQSLMPLRQRLPCSCSIPAQTMARAPARSFKDEPLYHASLAPAEYQVLLDDSGFEVVCHAVNDARSGGRTAWLCRRKPSR
jgi:hypothetical protein